MSSTIQNIISQTQTLGAQPKLALTRIRNFPVILPSIQEQEKIVEVLSDVDTLIADLQKLIRKKKDIRQGTMQMLVTGKKRLNGFDGEWVKINLSKNSKLKARIGWQGLTTAEYLDEGYSYLITGTDFKDGQIDWNGCHYVDYNRYEQDPNIQVSNGDLLLTKDGTIGKVAYVADLTRPATLNSGVFLVKPITDAYTAHFMIEVHGFYSALKKDILDNLSFSAGIMKLDSVQLKSLVDFLNSHDGYHLEELQDLIYKVYDDFIKIYQRLIPALALQYCKDDSFDFEVEGSTTSSFDSVKQFYLDVYEALGNLLVIPVALNNIKYRADANSMNPLEKNVSSLEDYIKLTKASRYHFCLNTEVYTDFLDVVVNAKLRNAIGHNDVEYDAVSQVITYIPNPKDRTVKKTEYLLEFENEAMHMFQALLGVSEYLYRLRELSLMYDGKIPLMVQERANWPKKIGRNDPCPCGSGKKYKFCHGKN